MILQFTIFLLVYFTMDALHDKYFLAARPFIYDRGADRMWHRVDSVIKGGIAIFVLYLLGEVSLFNYALYAIYFMAVRSLWFNLMLNLFRGLDFFHLSDRGIEGFIKERFSTTAYWLMSAFTVLLIFTIIQFKNV